MPVRAQRAGEAVPETRSTAVIQVCDVGGPGRLRGLDRRRPGRFAAPSTAFCSALRGGGDGARLRGTRHQPRPRRFAAYGGGGPGESTADTRVPKARDRPDGGRGPAAPASRGHAGPAPAPGRPAPGRPGPGPPDDLVPVLDPAHRLVDVEQVHQAHGTGERGVVAQVDQRVGGVEGADLDRPDHHRRAAREEVRGGDVEPAAQRLGQYERPVQVDDRAAGAAELQLAGHLTVEEVVPRGQDLPPCAEQPLNGLAQVRGATRRSRSPYDLRPATGWSHSTGPGP